MKSEVIELGHYDYREGGKIKLSINNNMKTNMGAFTQIHELNHMHLTYMTDLGLLLNIFEIERFISSTENSGHSKIISKYVDVINNAMIYVQEVYANSIELIMAEKTVGSEFVNKLYYLKTDEYRRYYDILSDVINKQSNTYMDKRLMVNSICYFAFSLDFESDQFLNELKSPLKLKQYLTGDKGPEKKMFQAIEIIKNNKDIEIKLNELDVIKSFIDKLNSMNLIKYSLDLIQKSIEYYFNEVESKVKNGEITINQIRQDYEIAMIKRIKVFELSKIKVIRDDSQLISNQIFVIKNCLNLDNIEDNYYLIEKRVTDNELNYIGQEVSESKLNDIVKESEFVMLMFQEFDFTSYKPKHFNNYKKPVIVIFDDYFECLEWINSSKITKDLYIGDLYDNTVNNFFTVLFFKSRIMDNTIFIFPTLSWLAKKLLEESNLEDEVVYSNNEAFLRVISCFGNEALMLKGLQGIISFITESKGDFTDLEDSSTKLNFDIARTLLNTVLKIKQRNYYELYSSLPTKNTIAEPFYAVMLFEDNINTGIIISHNEVNGILLFRNKIDATEWKNIRAKKDEIVVGIDRFYWDKVKMYLKRRNINIWICFDLSIDQSTGEVKCFDINTIDKMITSNQWKES